MSDHPRILVVRTDRLGDVILTLPVLSVLRDTFPRAYLGMLLQRYTGEIVVGHPALDAALWYDSDGVPVPAGEIVRTIRAHRFDAVILVHPTPRLAWLMVRARIPMRVGTGYRYYSPLFTHRVYDHRRDARFHELEYNLRLLRPLIPSLAEQEVIPRFDIPLDPVAAARVDAMLQDHGCRPDERIVVLHPGSGGSAHDWPVERYVRLASVLGGRDNMRVLVTGTSRDHAAVSAVQAGAGDRAVGLEGRLTLPELAVLLARASVVVSNSTGPLHLAAALGRPVVGLYSQITAMSARRWGPYTAAKRVLQPDAPPDCTLCRGASPQACVCMESISVDQVLHAVLEMLEYPADGGKRMVAHA